MSEDQNSSAIRPVPPGNVHFQLLESCLLFKNLPKAELESLGSSLRVLELQPRAVIIHEGDVGSHFYIVISGEIEVIKALGTKDERLLVVRGPGDFVGELSLLNPDGLRVASVRSRDLAEVWEITHVELEALIQRNPRMAYELMQLVSMRLTEAQSAMFADLQERNLQLSQAYQDLLAAQEQLVEKERLERELQVASEIQMSILPRELLKVPGFDFGARILPARAVGGDFFDVFRVGDRKIAFVIGDVSGKGVPAAIYMARVHAFLAAEAAHCSSAAEALRRVNHHLIQVDQNSMFVTVILGLVDLDTGQVSYARGGHELPVVVQPGGPPELADWEDGQILGIVEDLQLDEQTISLPAGGMLLLYTDGLIDGRSPQGESFGYDRLMEEAGRMAGIPAQEACDRLLERLMAFQDTEAQFDDVTLLALVVQ